MEITKIIITFLYNITDNYLIYIIYIYIYTYIYIYIHILYGHI